MVADLKLAITGGTGFVGGRLIELARVAGHEVRALTRRPQQPRDGVTWIQGALDDQASLDRLAEDADTLIHVAGVINAPDPAGFEAGNVMGTSAVIAAAEKAGVQRFIHVSSLSAREPKLSAYGASKAGSEALVAASALTYAIVRPPAVYGPGDKETFELYRMAKRGFIILPPEGRLSLIHVDDLGRLLLALSDPSAPKGLLVEPDDGRHGGWSHGEFGRALGKALGRTVATVSLSRPILDFFAKVDGWIRRDRAKLTADRVAYFCHPDWMVDPGRGAPEELWKPEVATEQGLADTAKWYREAGWL
ncbi:NAD(P)-dependent oxidoreductase [Sphingomonas sp. RB56-2]|uniref:NAD(P)-dependent oxidoreductase n=1 Tax=Sphingomonas brevis TaxID=2908206 RepID=A0ABT0S9J4_9SPHN|nr:NAD(P)-dependent oxidoreductase [Sphingomonas brevis]MCL6741076.1 NAD(P)-dependent oxidoreductase [Sphingomonas brevis]